MMQFATELRGVGQMERRLAGGLKCIFLPPPNFLPISEYRGEHKNGVRLAKKKPEIFQFRELIFGTRGPIQLTKAPTILLNPVYIDTRLV